MRRQGLYINAGLAAVLSVAAWLSAGCQAASPRAGSGPTAVGQAVAAAPALQATLTAPDGALRAGVNTLDLYLTDAAGQPIVDAVVTFDLDMTNMSMGVYQVEVPAAGAGHYVSPIAFSMPGPWRLLAFVDQPGQARTQVRFDFDVAAP